MVKPTQLKSDHFGIEICCKDGKIDDERMLKSDHFGIEIRLKIIFHH